MILSGFVLGATSEQVHPINNMCLPLIYQSYAHAYPWYVASVSVSFILIVIVSDIEMDGWKEWIYKFGFNKFFFEELSLHIHVI